VPASKGKIPALGQRPKRWLYIGHRWIGIASCLLFAIWFLSGLVMVYVPYPSLTALERVQGQDAIDWQRVNVQPAAALTAAGLALPKSMTLEMRDAAPVWRVEPWAGDLVTIPATVGATPAIADAQLARRVAHLFVKKPVLSV
jgi:uncharacterized iron-regulated membrane protein